MPNKTYVTKEEKTLPGHKPLKDRLTLLLCGDASGDFKLKPLLIYHSDNRRVFKKHNVIKQKLPVLWRSNSEAWLIVKEYLQKNKLPLKCLLLLDNAPYISEYLEEEFNFVICHQTQPPCCTPWINRSFQTSRNCTRKPYSENVSIQRMIPT